LVLELAARLKAAGLPLNLPATSSEAALPKEASDWIAKVVEDFVQAPRDCFVVAGRGQPPEVHAAAYYINEALGAVGPLVSLVPLEDVAWENPADLADLVRRINEGTVQTLILLGGNPAFNAPADLEFGTAIGLVENSIHLSTHVDETSHLADWHLPRAHFLESWGDARAADGSVSAIQPVIAPLYGGRSMIEVVGSLTRNEEVAGHDLVREVWSESLVREDFETNWRKTLHDGILEDSHLNPTAVRTREDLMKTVLAEMGSRPIEKGLEVVFTPSNNVFDGRFSNVSWLQETPDPITKIVWDNAALISPATAEELGLVEGQIVRLGTEERRIEVPVHIQPGQTDNSIALSLGYGRTSAGNVGSGVGANGYGLRTLQQLYVATGLELNGTKGRHKLVLTQEHWNMEGRSIVREAALQEFRSRPDFAQAPDSDLVLKSLWEEPDYSTGNQWGMTIDLNSCIGCNACVVACQSENNIPVVGREQISKGREMQWLRVDRYFSGSSDSPEVVHQPVPCMHCENAPCEEVCPVAATVHDGEGLNLMVYNRCIGTRYCSNNCPYKVRRFNFFNYTKDTPETVQLAMNPDVTVRSRGVMEKCTYCVQRINEAGIRAKSESREVRDGEIQTACQQTCPTQAISFGNINDPNSAVSEQRANNRNYQLLAELNNQPRTSFLAKLRNRGDREVES